MKKLIILFQIILIGLALPAQTWLKASAGAEYSLALRSDGTLWSWGFNGNGQLGLNTSESTKDTPQQIPGNLWNDVDAGAYHCLALKSDGTLWAWGLNAQGQ